MLQAFRKFLNTLRLGRAKGKAPGGASTLTGPVYFHPIDVVAMTCRRCGVAAGVSARVPCKGMPTAAKTPPYAAEAFEPHPVELTPEMLKTPAYEYWAETFAEMPEKKATRIDSDLFGRHLLELLRRDLISYSTAFGWLMDHTPEGIERNAAEMARLVRLHGIDTENERSTAELRHLVELNGLDAEGSWPTAPAYDPSSSSTPDSASPSSASSSGGSECESKPASSESTSGRGFGTHSDGGDE